jgi:hypothetical protein
MMPSLWVLDALARTDPMPKLMKAADSDTFAGWS